MLWTSLIDIRKFFGAAALFLLLLFTSNLEAKGDRILQPVTIDDIVSAGPRIVINVAARQLTLLEGDKLIKTYPIAVGQNRYRTPIGPRTLTQIVWNPWWLPPDSPWAADAKPTPPGPRNPLGPVKMDLGQAILVHGTNKERSIGSAASHGCMRMKNADVKELAQYIQSHYTLQNDPALFAGYEAKKGKSFYVKLENPIPVEIIYEIAKTEKDTLSVFSDVYYRYPWKVKEKLIEQNLIDSGFDIEKIDRDSLFKKIKEAKNKDVILQLQEFTQRKKNSDPQIITVRNDV